jgi:phenylacetic acid degradation operon negative regulatory protein
VGAPAARSVLLTILGEYVLPRQGGVWQETLIAALEAIDIKTHAARQALARSAAAGWLRSERHGRRSKVHLTPESVDMLRAGAERIYGFGEPWEWDGRWLLIVVRVPEERRDVRHQARTQLAWAGFGSLGGGLWISPHVGREREVVGLLDNEPAAELMSFRATPGQIGDAQRILSEAWDLDEVADTYRSFIERFRGVRPKTRQAVFAAQTMLVHEWRKFPFVDPDLPESLLPGRWPRGRALELFRSCHDAWHESAQEYFASLEALRDAA